MPTTVDPRVAPPVSEAAGNLAHSALQLAEHRLQLAWRHAKHAGAEQLRPTLWVVAAVALGVLAWLLFTAASVTALAPLCGTAGALAAVGGLHVALAAIAAWRARS